MTLPVAVVAAGLDRDLMPRDLSVYVFLYTQLDNEEYRPIKHVWLARRVRLSRSNVVRAVGRLVERGYLKQGPNDGGLRTYRLAVSPDPQSQAQQKERRRAPRETCAAPEPRRL